MAPLKFELAKKISAAEVTRLLAVSRDTVRNWCRPQSELLLPRNRRTPVASGYNQEPPPDAPEVEVDPVESSATPQQKQSLELSLEEFWLFQDLVQLHIAGASLDHLRSFVRLTAGVPYADTPSAVGLVGATAMESLMRGFRAIHESLRYRNLHQTATELVRHLQVLVPCASVSVFMLQGRRAAQLKLVAECAIPDVKKPPVIPVSDLQGGGLTAYLASAGRIANLTLLDVTEGPEAAYIRPESKGNPPVSILFYPLKIRGQLVGAIKLTGRRAADGTIRWPMRFSRFDQIVVELMGSQFLTAIVPLGILRFEHSLAVRLAAIPHYGPRRRKDAIEVLAGRAADSLRWILPADRVELLYREAANNRPHRFIVAAVAGEGADVSPVETQDQTNWPVLAHHALSTGRAQFDDFENSKSPLSRHHGVPDVRSAFAVPLEFSVGGPAIVVFAESRRPNHFTKNEVELVLQFFKMATLLYPAIRDFIGRWKFSV